jgi:PAS domain S-box-containing protein
MFKRKLSVAGLPVGIIALCTAIIAVLWAALIFDIDRMERSALKQAGSDALNLATAFRENIERTVSAIDQLMLTILAANRENGQDYNLPKWAASSPLLTGMSVQISMSDANGIMAASSLGSGGRVDISDRPHFRYHLDPTAPQPYISVPVIGRNSGKWSIQVTRRITHSDGSFGGILVVSVDPLYFSEFFERVDLGRDGSVDLVGRDGIIRARRAKSSQGIGQDLNDRPFFKRMLSSGTGTEIVRSQLDGITRLFGFTTVPDYPLMVAVGLAVDDVMEPLHRQRNLYLAIGGVLTLIILSLGWYFARETKRRHQQELAAHAEKMVREQKILLDTALQNMSHGLCMFDADGRIVLFNGRYQELMGVSAEFLQGISLLDLFKHRKTTGDFKGDPEKFFADVMKGVRSGKWEAHVMESRNGRILNVVDRPMAGGGWVATFEDITEQRRAEKTVREQKELLDTAVNNMRHGLLMFDRDNRAVVINQAYQNIYGLSPETAKPGCTIRELLEQRVANGTFAGNIDDYISNYILNNSVVDKIFDNPDGRSIRVVNRFMDKGGWVSIHEDVTEKRQAEIALQKALTEAERAGKEANAAHTRLRDAFDVVPEGLALFDADDRYVLWNRKYAELYSLDRNIVEVGQRFEDVLRAGLAAGLYLDAVGREQEWLAERLARHAQSSSIHEQRLPNNRWLQICERRTADGGSVGIRIDITELKQREQSVRMLFEFNPVPMFVVDIDDLKFLAVNHTAARHYGYSREQFLTMTKLDIHPPEEREGYVEIFGAFRESQSTEFDSDTIRRHRKADAKIILVQVYGRRLNYNGRDALLCSIIDVTERVEAEKERDRSRTFLDRIIDNITIAIQVKDARTLQYVLVNKAAERLWGLPREQLVGKTPHEIFDKDFADTIVAHDHQLIEANANFFLPEHKIETLGNGARIVTSNRIAICDHVGDVQYLVGVVEDVTERKAVEDQLRQAQKMEAVGNLTGGVAHDFNNLLTVIMCNLDLLQEDVAGNAEAEEKINVILEAAERGADLTRHMLAFSRRQPLQATEVDVNALIATTLRLLNRTLGENIFIAVHPAADLPVALVDPSQLETALMNIAINARDAMPDGGTLTISTSVADLDEDYAAHHPGVTPGTYVSVAVADSGIGMAPELLERIFEPFFTTKAAGQGTGLGLSMVYGFIKQSGGHINAYSEVGRGTVFKLFLPLAKSAASKPGRQSTAPRAVRSSGHEVILAVEDNPDIRATVVRQLRDLGYRVHEADSAESALQILDSAAPIDLLFTDMIMPGGLNGKELATKARAKRADLRVLFTSGFLGTAAKHGPQLEPGDVLLNKPYHKHDLAKAVEETLSTLAPGIVPHHGEEFPASEPEPAVGSAADAD